MADYICKHCKFNNNGWCVALKKNSLSKIVDCDTFIRGKYGDFEKKTTKSRKKYRVHFERCFYDDMDGYEVAITDTCILLEFNLYTGVHRVMFFKNQLEYKGEF